MSVVRVDHLAHDRQAEAGALRLGREERTENSLEIVGRDAGPVVAHFDDDLRRQRLDRRPAGSSSPGSSVAADLDVPFAAERLERVGEQVREQLPQLMRVGEQLRHVRRDSQCRSTPRRAHLAFGERDRILEHLVERHALDLQLNRPHELEHFDDDGVGHLGFLDDVVERLERFGLLGQLALQHAGHDLDARQRVLDLVRDRRGHLAERRQPIAQPLAFLDLLDARQILEEQRRADESRRRRRECARACSRSRGRSCAAASRRGWAGRRSRTPAAGRARPRGSRAGPRRTAGRCRPARGVSPSTRYAMSFIAATRPSRVIARTPVRRLKTRCRKKRSPKHVLGGSGRRRRRPAAGPRRIALPTCRFADSLIAPSLCSAPLST